MTSSPLKTPTPSGSFLSLTPTPTGTRLGFRRIPLPFARGSLVGYFSPCVNSVCFLAFGARGKEERKERREEERRVRAPKENKAEIEKPFSCDANIESLDKSADDDDTSLPDAHVSVRSCPRVKLFVPVDVGPPDWGLPRRGRGTPETRRAGHFPPGRSVSPSWLSTLRLLEQVPGVPPVSLWRPLGPLSWSPGGINTILAAPPCLSPVRPPQPPSSPLAWLERPPLGLSPHAADVLHTHALHTTVHSTVVQEQEATRAERGQWTRRGSRKAGQPSLVPPLHRAQQNNTFALRGPPPGSCVPQTLPPTSPL